MFVSVRSKKSVVLGVSLAILFGPFGLLYATVRGGMIMLIVDAVLTLVGLFVLVPVAGFICVVWTFKSIVKYNEEIEMSEYTPYQIDESVIEEIGKNLILPEMGGILGTAENRIVTKFYYDSTGTTTKTRYIPDVQRLNVVIESWAREGVSFVGYVHTHPKGMEKLSPFDIDYAQLIKKSCNMPEILMVIYIPEEGKIFQYSM